MRKMFFVELALLVNIVVMGGLYINEYINYENNVTSVDTSVLSLKIDNYLTSNEDFKGIINEELERERKAEEERIAKEEAERKRKEEAAKKAREEEIRKYYNLLPKDLSGYSTGSEKMIQIAASQIGNKGGAPYWSWYGFNGRVDWCAIFVSWVANQAGYLNTAVPRFSVVSTAVNWYRDRGELKSREFPATAGDIIFFDWNTNGLVDHVGFVEKIENGRVYTIEGNSADQVIRRSYKLTNNSIYGYGVPSY